MDKVKFTREMVRGYLTQYHKIKQNLLEEQAALSKVQPAASIAQYGIEATMPKAQGGVSDPTFNQATSIPTNIYIQRGIAITRAIEGFKKHVNGFSKGDVYEYYDPQLPFVFGYWLDGLTIEKTAKKLGVSNATVHRNREKIIELILKGENEG